ncbi:MAG: hypothetical protein HRU40_16590 [Saprospiraceae bacterium]|nr:hypothetical protein [Saprospiraceae bacterium]
MSPAEKRYYKRHYGSSANTLTDLFDVINGQRTYQEEAVKEAFAGKVATNLKVYKFQFEQQLLQSLVSYRYFSSVGSKIRQGLEQVEILVERNLADMALKQLEKTKQLCLEYEEFPYLLDVASKEFQLKYIRLNGYTTSSQHTFEEHKGYLEVLDMLNNLTTLVNHISDLSIKSYALRGADREELKKFLEHPLLQQPVAAAPKRTSFSIAHARGSIYSALGNYKKAFVQYEFAVDLFNKDKNLADHFAFYYLFAIRRTIQIAILAGQVAKAKLRIEEANQFIAKRKQYVTHLLHIIRSELELSILTGGTYLKQNQLERKISKLIRHLTPGKEGLIAVVYVLLVYNLVIIKNYSGALDYLLILEETDPISYSSVQEVASILTMIVYYEHSDKKASERVINRYIKKGVKNPYYDSSPVYAGFLSFFGKLVGTQDVPEDLAKDLLAHINEYPDDRVTKQLKDYYLIAWLKGQAGSVPVSRILST